MTTKMLAKMMEEMKESIEVIDSRLTAVESKLSTAATTTAATKKLSKRQQAAMARRAEPQGKGCLTAISFKELMVKNHKEWADVSPIYEGFRTSKSLEGKQKAYYKTAKKLGWL